MIIRLLNPEVLANTVSSTIPDLDLGFNAELWLSNVYNIALTDGLNVAMFEAVEGAPLIFSAHTLFEARGADALNVGRQMLTIMFDQFNALVIEGLTPAHKRAARYFNRKLGFSSKGVIGTVNGPQELFVLERDKWVS